MAWSDRGYKTIKSDFVSTGAFIKIARLSQTRLVFCSKYPVSILSVVSKILEKSVYTQLVHFLDENNILFEFQSGFRSKFSTDTCLIHLFDYIKSNTSKGLFTGMLLLDLQKAFDTVDHDILCKKLEAIGVISVDWFKIIPCRWKAICSSEWCFI